MKTFLAIFAGVLAGGLLIAPTLAQTISPAPYTQAQADAGRESYMTSCASCHNEDLSGKGAPALAGKTFIDGAFGKRPVAQLYTFIHNSMPFCEGGSLANETYLNIVAFLLEANGAKAGNEALTPDAAVKVSDIATGEMPPGLLKSAKAN
jgi:alcohol dehydrogenase (cytochrome c)